MNLLYFLGKLVKHVSLTWGELSKDKTKENWSHTASWRQKPLISTTAVTLVTFFVSLSLSLPFPHWVDIPQTHITGSESLHPTVPALWCHKHTQAKKYEMEKVGAVGGWWLNMSERGYSTEEWSQRCFLGNQPPYITFISYFLKYFQQLGKVHKEIKWLYVPH